MIKKKIEVLTFIQIIFCALLFAQEYNGTQYIAEQDYSQQKLIVFKVDGENREVLKEISFDDYEWTFYMAQSDKAVYFVSKDHYLQRLPFDTLEIEDAGIKGYSFSFSVTSDDRYFCIGTTTPELLKAGTFERGIINTLIPSIYNLKTREKISFSNFSTDFLLDNIGINLSVKYNEEENRFDIAYGYDSPIPQFTGFITLDTFTYESTTHTDLGEPYRYYRHEAWTPAFK